MDLTGFVIDTDSTSTVTFLNQINDALCSGDCKKCAGVSGTCYDCKYLSIKPILQGYSCSNICQSDHYQYSTTDLNCIRCYFTCGSCLGPQSTDCTSCAAGYVKSDSSCVTNCPAGTTNQNGICINTGKCTAPCISCSTSSNFCLSCDISLPVIYKERGECKAEQTSLIDYCPSSYFQNTNKICQKCDSNCSDCYNSASFCNSCPIIYGQPNLNQIDHSCVDQCPTLISIFDSTNKVCVPCYDACLTCDGTNSNNCLSCPETGTKYITSDNQCLTECPSPNKHYFSTSLKVFQCISTCPSNYYFDSTSNTCLPCMITCLTCSDSTTCDSCDPLGAYPYYADTKLCISMCSSSQFIYVLNGDKKCFTSSCPSPALKYLDSTNNFQPTCISGTSCPSEKYFITPDGISCLECHPLCLTCYGIYHNNCLSCDLETQNTFITADHQCNQICPSNQFTFTFNNEKKCVINCSPNYLNIDSSATEKACITDCPTDHYLDIANSYCRPCYNSCETCSGGASTDCETCGTNFIYLSYMNECKLDCDISEYKYTLDGNK